MTVEFQLAQAIGMTRGQTDGLLKKHGVTEDLVGLDEFRREAVSLHEAR